MIKPQIPTLITSENSVEANARLERRLKIRKLVDSIFDTPRPQKWVFARNVWVSLCKENAQAHIEAVREVKHERTIAVDKKYGRTKAAMGLAHGQRVNKNTSTRLVAIFPAPGGENGLVDWLKRVDPMFLGAPTGKEYRKNWREVYKVFPEYVVPEKIDYWEGQDGRGDKKL